jgi:hypothetical protein
MGCSFAAVNSIRVRLLTTIGKTRLYRAFQEGLGMNGRRPNLN